MMDEIPFNTNHILKSESGLRSFALLVQKVGTTTKTNEKLKALVEYFSKAHEKDKVWVIAIFSGRRPRRIASGSLLATWCCEKTLLPFWLFTESYHTVGDLGETIALLLPPKKEKTNETADLHYYLEQIISLEKVHEDLKKEFIVDCWAKMDTAERFVFNKLLTGSFRIGVSQKIIINALAKVVSADASQIAHRISGNWDPVTTSFDELLVHESLSADVSRPYPFYLSYALSGEPQSLGAPDDWQVEWKWDGIRGQIIKRNDELFVWSRGEELMTEKFPEYQILKEALRNGTVLDGEIIPLTNGEVLPFSLLQTRIGRKNISRKNLEDVPVGFIAYDLLEYGGEDFRNVPLFERRKQLEAIVQSVNHPSLQISLVIDFNDWDELAATREMSRSKNAEGLMIKKKDSVYRAGRKTGDWWKWKINPLTIDAVMIYAQKGSGRRSNLYTDYTFAVKDGDKLVSFAKAYSGLTDKEFAKVDYFVKRNSLEKFGPVRTVKPELVFEIAFEGIAASNRHKSGVALRFPRISRWRHDKKADEINTLDDLKEMLKVYGNAEVKSEKPK
ncbi:MAG: ATP-dependent DNA ligase [Ginsengibacter sp.]